MPDHAPHVTNTSPQSLHHGALSRIKPNAFSPVMRKRTIHSKIAGAESEVIDRD
jgi:hypothetical protein